MGNSAQNSNPWTNIGPRSAGPSGVPGGGVNPWAGWSTRGATGGPTSVPGGGSNQFAGWGTRGAGGGPVGGGVPPAGPSITQPGSIDPRFTLPETGGPFNPMTGSRTAPPPSFTGMDKPYAMPTNSGPGQYFQDPMNKPMALPGSTNASMTGTAPYAGQAAPSDSGGSFTRDYRQVGPVNSGQGQYYQDPQKPMDDQGYVRSLYSGLLGRDPSQDEVSNASQALTGQYGGNRNALADFFRNSDEFKARGPNAYQGPGSGAPYDPRTPGYQPGAGWQAMLRQYAQQDGQSNPNQYVTDRRLNPMWGDQQQPWEPTRLQSNSLADILRQYRGY